MNFTIALVINCLPAIVIYVYVYFALLRVHKVGVYLFGMWDKCLLDFFIRFIYVFLFCFFRKGGGGVYGKLAHQCYPTLFILVFKVRFCVVVLSYQIECNFIVLICDSVTNCIPIQYFCDKILFVSIIA